MHMQEKHPWRQSTPSIAAVCRNSYDEFQDDIFVHSDEGSPADYGMIPARSVPNLNMDGQPNGSPNRRRGGPPRELMDSRRPWYNNPDYVGPKTLLEGADDEDRGYGREEEEEPVIMRRRGRNRPSDRLQALQHDVRLSSRQCDSLDSLVPLRRALAASGSGQKYLHRNRHTR